MDKYEIMLYPRAYRDIHDIYAYIALEKLSPETAKEQTDRIWQAIKKLELFPKSHQDRLVGRYAGKEYKQLIIDNYIAIFKVDENKKRTAFFSRIHILPVLGDKADSQVRHTA